VTTVDRAGAVRTALPPRLLDDDGRNKIHPSMQRADTTLADIEGLLHGTRSIPAPSWPLVAALSQQWSQADPLVWLAELPITEGQTLEKARLAGTTVKVSVSHGSPRTRAAWTDVSRQAAAHGPALAAIVDLLAHSVAIDTDRYIAQTLASLATFAGGANVALATIGPWPGPRLVVLAPNAMGEMRDWMAYAEASNGALRVIADPYIVENLCIATAGVALGINGPERLTADQPSHLGVDVANMVTFVLEVAPGAIATWESTGFGGSGGTNPLPSPLLVSITPDTITAGSPALLTVLAGSNFDPSMSARVTRAPNPPLYVPATYSTLTEATMIMPESEMVAPGILQVHVVVPSGTPTPESNQVPFFVTAPPTPTLVNITPDRAGVGAIDKFVWLEGTGFTPTMQALSAFAAEAALVHPTVYISPTAAFFTLPAAQMDLQGTVQISVRVAYAPADSNALPFEVLPPLAQPTLIDITPDFALAGTAGVVVTMTGTNFADPMSARLTIASSGIPRDAPATVLSLTSATFIMPDDLIDTVGKRVDVQAYVWLAVPALSANSLPFRATALTPILTALEPNTVNANASDTTIIARGSNFESPMFAVLSGMAGSLPCFNVAPTEAKFTIPAAQLVAERIVDIFVRCTDSEPTDSNSLPFTVSGAPILTDITPDQKYVQDPAVLLTATGQNFTPDCVLYVTNTPLDQSTVVSLTEMTGMIQQAIGTTQITVRDGQGNTSQQLPFLVIPKTPTITNITPDQFYYEDPAQRLTIDGTNFYAGMHAYDNGTDKGAVTIVSATQCYFSWDGPVGTHQIKVGWHNGLIGGYSTNIFSNELPLSCVNKPLPVGTVLTAINPDSAPSGTYPVSCPITLTGDNFDTGGAATMRWRYLQGATEGSAPITVVNKTTATATWDRQSTTFGNDYNVWVTIQGNSPAESPNSVSFRW